MENRFVKYCKAFSSQRHQIFLKHVYRKGVHFLINRNVHIYMWLCKQQSREFCSQVFK